MSARFEVVWSDAGWHARFRAANGQVVWVTESYTRKRAAVRDVEAIVDYGWIEDDAVVCLPSRESWNKRNRPVTEVRYIDERTS